MTVLRTDRRVIEPGRDGMREHDLSIVVLQHERACSLQYAERTALLETRRVLTRPDAFAPSLDANHAHILVVQESVKQSNSVAAAADTSHQFVRQPFFLLQNLPPRLATNNTDRKSTRLN